MRVETPWKGRIDAKGEIAYISAHLKGIPN